MGKAQKAFLTLVYIKAGENYLKHLQKAQLTDDHLPISTALKNNGIGDDDDDDDDDDNDDDNEYETYGLNVDGTRMSPQAEALASFARWSGKDLEDFVERQWLFLVPTFREDKFVYEFHGRCRLPFVATNNATSTDGGYFGVVRRLDLLIEKKDSTRPYMSETRETPMDVALKCLTIWHDQTITDVEKFYNKETETLGLMRSLKHPHLIEAIAAYKKGNERCFVFPWAQGGNLQNFWKTDASQLNEELVTWAIDQMTGISGGIMKLHEKNTRHGDIKPENILCFPSSGKNSGRGTLVVADVGLAKVHKDYTRDRVAPTSTRHGSETYEPPEMPGYLRGKAISRKYDIWSLGCIFLEFTIRLLYGWDGLKQFQLKIRDTDLKGFWEITPEGNLRNSTVNKWIEKISKEVNKPTALSDLVHLISTKLLVPVANNYRATARVLFSELKEIQQRCADNGSYILGPGVIALANQGPDPAHPDGENHTPRPDQYWNVTLQRPDLGSSTNFL